MSRTVENRPSLMVPALPDVLALPTEQRQRQLREVLRAPDWMEQISIYFPDAVNQREIETQLQILNNITKAYANRKKWDRAAGAVVAIGVSGIVAGTGLNKEEVTLGGVLLLMFGSLVFMQKAQNEGRKIDFNTKKWEGLAASWWIEK